MKKISYIFSLDFPFTVYLHFLTCEKLANLHLVSDKTNPHEHVHLVAILERQKNMPLFVNNMTLVNWNMHDLTNYNNYLNHFSYFFFHNEYDAFAAHGYRMDIYWTTWGPFRSCFSHTNCNLVPRSLNLINFFSNHWGVILTLI